MNDLPKGLNLRLLPLVATVLPWSLTGLAAEPLTAVAPAHGPVLMLYISQPLGSRGASRVYGLRLQQNAQQPSIATTMATSQYALAPRRALVDLQIRHEADVRVEFGERVTWSVTRRELDLSGSASSKGSGAVSSLAFAPAWRSRP